MSVIPVPTTQDALHPGRAYISRATLSDAEAAAQLEIVVPLKMTNFADLQARLAQGERIPPKEMAAKYEPTEAQYQQVVKFLKSQGFTITLLDSHHLAVFAEAPVHQVASALHVNFARVTAEGHEYTSAISEPTIPDSLKGFVMGVNGLQPHIRPHPHAFNLRPAAAPSPNSLGGPSYYTPQQIASVYNVNPLYTAGATGAGQSIAIVIDAFPSTSDLTSFWSGMGISQSLANITLIQAVAGTMPTPYDEETLDTEWASSMAPGAQVRVYGTTSLAWNNLEKGYVAILNDAQNHPEYGIHQMSMSYGLGEVFCNSYQAPLDDMYYAELTAAGVTCFASSGDGGATPAGNTNTNSGTQITAAFPSTDPNVTAVGGTSLNAPNGVESDEEVWSGSGGGVSIYFPRPSWQNGNGVGSSATMRQVPDIAAAADPYHGARIFLNGQWMSVGGTSWSSPTCAAMMALINQARASVNLPAVGLLNSKIYPLIGTTCFRDITAGSNSSPTSGGLYNATVGYDLCTGIGSMQAYNLAAQLSSSPSIALSPASTLSLGSSQVGTTAPTSVLTISNSGSAILNVTGITMPAHFTADWSSGSLEPGGSQTVNVTCTATAIGTYSGNISISSNAGSTATTLPVTATIAAPPAPVMAVAPTGTLSLAAFQVGATPSTRSFTISNTGNAPLIVNGVTAPSLFSADWSSGSIAAGGSQTVNVTCTASAAGSYTGNITISDNASSTPTTVAVTATVTPLPAPVISVSPAGGLNLGSFVVGDTLPTATLTISNTGNATLNVSGISAPSGFGVNWSSGAIAAGGSQQVIVSCTASSAGSYEGNLTISSDASPVTVAVTATATSPVTTPPVTTPPVTTPPGTTPPGTTPPGTTPPESNPTGTQAPVLALNPAALTLPSVVANKTPASGTFVISNTGTADLVVSGITYPGVVQGNWSAGTIAAGGSQTVIVTATTTAQGTYSGAIAINSNTTAAQLPVSYSVTPAPVAPTIAVGASGSLSGNSITLNATVNPNGSATQGYFQYGLTTAYGSQSSSSSMGSGTSGVQFLSGITGLSGSTTYHYRAVASNVAGTVYSGDYSFKTLVAPTISPVSISQDGTSIKLSGSVNPLGVAATADIQYGTTLSYGSQTSSVSITSKSKGTTVGGVLCGLLPNTTYYYRIAVTSSTGTYYQTGSFTTPNVSVSTVLAQGGAAPGVNGATFASFGNPAINGSDNIAFQAVMKTGAGGVSTANESGLWAMDQSGNLGLIAREGNAAPGVSGATFATFTDPVYNANHQVAFSGTLKGVATTVGSGVWSNSSGALTLVARVGDATPGISGGVFSSFTSVALPDQGGVLLLAKINSGATGLWEGTAESNLQLLAETGEVIDGKTVTGVSVLPTGQVQSRTFSQEDASLAGVVTFSDNSTAILTLIGEDWSLPVISSSAAMGAGSGTYASFGNPVINATHNLAYAAKLSTGVSGVWFDAANNFSSLVALSGATAPGSSATFSAFNDPVENAANMVAFRATLSNKATGIWMGSAGSVGPVALSGGQAPNCPGGVTYSAFTAMGLPDQGGVIFTATLAGSGVTTTTNTAIFAQDMGGAVIMIMRAGDSYNGKTVASFKCLSAETSAVGSQTRNFIQEEGDMVFNATFTDKTTALIKVVFP